MALWAVSGALSLAGAAALVAISVGRHRAQRLLAVTLINVTRGVPTSLLVVFAGVFAGRLQLNRIALPDIFPNTPPGFQATAWALAVALALGSCGHLAVIMQAAYETLGPSRRYQAQVLGLSRHRHGMLLARESAPIAAAPVTNRLIHHLHNTAFAGLFPVVELFGVTQRQADETFRVVEVALVAVALYAGLSFTVWVLGRLAERALTVPPDRQRHRGIVSRTHPRPLQVPAPVIMAEAGTAPPRRAG